MHIDWVNDRRDTCGQVRNKLQKETSVYTLARYYSLINNYHRCDRFKIIVRPSCGRFYIETVGEGEEVAAYCHSVYVSFLLLVLILLQGVFPYDLSLEKLDIINDSNNTKSTLLGLVQAMLI